MGKRVFFQKQNHMDLVWRRCWDRSPKYRGSFIRSYAQVEEMIIDSDIALMEKESGYVTSIEQALTVRKYLERNPDKLPLLKKLVRQGNIELLGGGESIIDYNMVLGESIVRNFLYGIRWYEREFGVRNTAAIVTDSFGVSPQLPQIFRKLGFDYVTQIGRVFENKKTFWRGIDGTLICFKDPMKDMQGLRAFVSLESYAKYDDCGICKGSGCEHCHYTGLDTISYKFSDRSLVNTAEGPSAGMLDDPHLRALEYARTCPQDEATIYLSSEEILQDARLPELISEYRTRYGMDISFMKKDQEYQEGAGEERRKLREAPESIAPEEIDRRSEGNCVSTGCYVSRISLKQTVREAENLLIAAEKLASLAWLNGCENYPARKIERLWNMLNLVQFHDALTASHTDDAYDELTDCLRNILLGSDQICGEAIKHLNGRIVCARPDSGGMTFVLYNTLSWDRGGVHRVVLQFEEEPDAGRLEIEDDQGNSQEIVEVNAHELTRRRWDVFQKRYSAEIKFRGSAIPALGYRTFALRWKTCAAAPALLPPVQPGTIENEYYLVRFDEYGISGILDKELGREIGTAGTNELILEEDFGSPWETLARPFNWTKLRKKTRVTSIEGLPGKYAATIEGAYCEGEDLFNGNPEQQNRIAWKQTVTLVPGVKSIDFVTKIDWDTTNRRVKIAFPLGFQPERDKAWYEIPYGAIERERYEGEFGIHTKPNGDWPALNWVEAYNPGGDYGVALLNKGLPCHRVENGTLYLSVLRSPQIPIYIFGYQDARDAGTHLFEYSLYSHKGSLAAGNTHRAAQELNVPEKSMPLDGGESAGALPASGSFISLDAGNASITSVKVSEEGKALILRINETKGLAGQCSMSCSVPVARCFTANLLEEAETEISTANGSVRFDIRPFDILTLRLELQKDYMTISKQEAENHDL